MTTKAKYRLTITLRSGESRSFEVAKMPRYAGSWLMQQMPYGTDFGGMTITRERLS